MQFTKFTGLDVNYETGETKFEMPEQLAKLDALSRIDLLTNIMGEMYMVLRESVADYFMSMVQKNFKPSHKFEEYYRVFQQMLDQMGIDELEGLKELCLESFNQWIKDKSQSITPEGVTIN